MSSGLLAHVMPTYSALYSVGGMSLSIALKRQLNYQNFTVGHKTIHLSQVLI